MWANTLVKKSGRPFVRAVPVNNLASSLGSFDTSSRSFSSDDARGKHSPFGSGGGRGGGGGRGQGGHGGRGDGDRGNQMNHQQNHGRRPNKPNYAKEFLDPAARGELKHHRSPVPKTTGKKAKGHAVRGADAPLPKEDEEELDFLEMEEVRDFTMEKQDGIAQKTGTVSGSGPMEQLTPLEKQKIDDFLQDYQLLINSDQEEQYYWNERDYDISEDVKRAEVFERLQAEATRDADGNLVVEVDDETFALFDGISEESAQGERRNDQNRQPGSPADDPVFQFVTEAMGVQGADKPPPDDYDRVLPLQLSGPTIYDFVESMMNHPSKYGEVRWDAPNEERDREPLAELPPNRRNPSIEFVEAHKRFMYVWGLPPLLMGDEPFDLDNPIHCMEIQKLVGSCFDVPLEQVSVASPSSAFVGFTSIEDQKFAIAVGPMSKTIESPVVISKYEPSENFALAKEHPDALVLLENLPLGLTPTLMATSLFPSGTEVGAVYGTMSSRDIVMLSPNSAVIGMQSAEAAENAISSALVKERLAEIGQHQIRYSKARRELGYTGTHGGPDGTEPLRKLGSKLIVDGDMPTKALFTSHASTLFLRNLDPTVTKQDIAEYFQPFCSVARDVQGSAEFVTCREGLPTGRAFVGFDELEEAEAALKALSQGGGRLVGLGPNTVIAKQVKERMKRDLREKRPTRSEDDLLDSLNNWQQHVDPEDLKELLDHDISIEALDEAFRTIRYNNTTFASMDQAMRRETVNPDKMTGGMYKELVQTYIATLKECLTTPENPGPIYESIHFPDEELDTEIFEREPARQEELRKRREVP